MFADLHREHGVDLRLGVQVAEIARRAEAAVTGVELADGTRGRRPTGAWSASGRSAERRPRRRRPGSTSTTASLVDAHLRTSTRTSTPPATSPTPYHPVLGRHIRVEHWANALHQPAVAAQSMLGQDVGYDRLPYFFTDQYDLGMEYIGYAERRRYDEVVVRGDLAGAGVHRVLAARGHGRSPG